MPKTFMDALTKHGVSYEVRSNDVKDNSEMTLSNGVKVRTFNKAVVTRHIKGKKGASFSYTVCQAKIIR